MERSRLLFTGSKQGESARYWELAPKGQSKSNKAVSELEREFKKIMKTLFLAIVILGGTANLVQGQAEVDQQFMFKTWLFLDSEQSKTDTLLETLIKAITLNISQVESNQFGIPMSFHYLKVYDLRTNKVMTDAVTYKDERASAEFGIPVNKYIGQYVIALNKNTNRSYRLLGFNGNDFMMFLEDFKEEFYRKHGEKLSNKHFLNTYHVNDIDFHCLYEGLRSRAIDRNKTGV